MRKILTVLCGALACGVALPAWAQLDVSNAWIRGTAPGQTATGAFMTLHAHENAKLVGASSTVSKHAEIHEMKMEGTTMRMREVPFVTLPSMQDVELKPGAGGYHVMLTDLKRALKTGEKVPVTLVVQMANGKKIKQVVQAEVRALNAPMAGKMPHMASGAHMHHH